MDTNKSKKALDSLIKKSRVHFYKPIQIAEILHKHRIKDGIDLLDLESYRNISKRWRDEVSGKLIGRSSTSSQKYQDNLFESNAIPPEILAELGKINKTTNGGVEAYIYQTMKMKFSELHSVADYISNATPQTFDLDEVISIFTKTAGLKRSIDKVYEISVYALFATIVRALRAEIILKIKNEDKEILVDFSHFVEAVLGITSGQTEIISPANLYRVGATNAADRGLDMWSNFGPVVQVKHLTLTPATVEDIAIGIAADKIVIVCLNAEKDSISMLLEQVGWGSRIQGIITLDDLRVWYGLCMGEKYREKLGITLLKDMRREFEAEFPSGAELLPFLEERGYSKEFPENWEII
jgi:type II restriction enzyme